MVAFDATAQPAADSVAPPVTLTPDPLPLSAIMQPGASALISAYAVALTDKVALVVTALASNSGSLVVTVTCTA
jgi:hypothetical protein